MIFTDKYNNQKSELFREQKYKEFNLPNDATYTKRSLDLIYEMYCRRLNTTRGICLARFYLDVPDDIDECSESVLDKLFHDMQEQVKHRDIKSDNSIGMVSKTYRQDLATIHEGYFLISIPETQALDILRGDIGPTLEEMLSLPSKLFSKSTPDSVNDDEIKTYSLHFRLEGKYDNHGIILSDADIQSHEQGFNIISDIAQLPVDSADSEPPLFRVRYGYIPGVTNRSAFTESVYIAN